VIMDRSHQELDKYQTGVLAAINISGGGVPKRRVTGARVSRSGLENDTQNDQKHHGGPDRAVCVYSLERIRALQAEGHPIDVGTVGENVTVEGIDWDLVIPGANLRLGSEVILEVASFTNPCKKIRESFIDGRFVRISQKLYPGWSRVYTRVLSGGQIRAGDPVELTLASGIATGTEGIPRTVPLLNSRADPSPGPSSRVEPES
jgi:MOSC domain-containing protein YiiM